MLRAYQHVTMPQASVNILVNIYCAFDVLVYCCIVADVDRERRRQETVHRQAMVWYARSPSPSELAGEQWAGLDVRARRPATTGSTPVMALPRTLVDLRGTPSASPTSWVAVDLTQPPPTVQPRMPRARWGYSEPPPTWSPIIVAEHSVSALPPRPPAASLFRGLNQGPVLQIRRRLHGEFVQVRCFAYIVAIVFVLTFAASVLAAAQLVYMYEIFHNFSGVEIC